LLGAAVLVETGGLGAEALDAQMRRGQSAVFGANEQQHSLLMGESLAVNIPHALTGIYSPGVSSFYSSKFKKVL
jgi:hypothetical protein